MEFLFIHYLCNVRKSRKKVLIEVCAFNLLHHTSSSLNMYGNGATINTINRCDVFVYTLLHREVHNMCQYIYLDIDFDVFRMYFAISLPCFNL